MKGKPLEMSLLFDFYGETLTEKQRELFDLYYNEDLSLAEIAEHAGITRQGVRDSIKRAEHALHEMEDKLGLVARYGDTERCAEELQHEVAPESFGKRSAACEPLTPTHCTARRRRPSPTA